MASPRGPTRTRFRSVEPLSTAEWWSFPARGSVCSTLADMDAWGQLLLDVRRRHLGVLHVDDGAAHCISEARLRRRATNEGWPHPYPCVFVLPGVVPREAVLAYAAVRSVRGGVAVTNRTARALYGLGPWPGRPELLLPHDRRHRAAPTIHVVRSRRITRADVQAVSGVPTTSIARTALGLAAGWRSARPVRDFLVDAFQRHLATPGEVVALLQRTRGVTGRPLLDEVVKGLLEDWVDSRLEDDTRELLLGLGFAVAPHPFPFKCDDGRIVHLDVALPELWHAVECDGAGAHMDRRSFETDRVRWSEIQRSGVTLSWVTRRRLESDAERIAEEIVGSSRSVNGRAPMQPAHDCVAHGCRAGSGSFSIGGRS